MLGQDGGSEPAVATARPPTPTSLRSPPCPQPVCTAPHSRVRGHASGGDFSVFLRTMSFPHSTLQIPWPLMERVLGSDFTTLSLGSPVKSEEMGEESPRWENSQPRLRGSPSGSGGVGKLSGPRRLHLQEETSQRLLRPSYTLTLLRNTLCESFLHVCELPGLCTGTTAVLHAGGSPQGHGSPRPRLCHRAAFVYTVPHSSFHAGSAPSALLEPEAAVSPAMAPDRIRQQEAVPRRSAFLPPKMHRGYDDISS